jgi:hypothetical protein
MAPEKKIAYRNSVVDPDSGDTKLISLLDQDLYFCFYGSGTRSG